MSLFTRFTRRLDLVLVAISLPRRFNLAQPHLISKSRSARLVTFYDTLSSENLPVQIDLHVLVPIHVQFANKPPPSRRLLYLALNSVFLLKALTRPVALFTHLAEVLASAMEPGQAEL